MYRVIIALPGYDKAPVDTESIWLLDSGNSNTYPKMWKERRSKANLLHPTSPWWMSIDYAQHYINVKSCSELHDKLVKCSNHLFLNPCPGEYPYSADRGIVVN